MHRCCECGCGRSYPEDQMVSWPTGYDRHPIEYVHVLHYLSIWVNRRDLARIIQEGIDDTGNGRARLSA